MSIKKLQTNKNTFYFCTITCHNWLPLFEMTNLYDHIYQWFDILKSKKIFISGFVIMPNHIHLIIFLSGSCDYVNKVIGTGKRFMSYEIVKRLKKQKRIDILSELNEAVERTDRRRGKKHEVFEHSFDLKEITTEKFLIQKLSYIHKNPVSGKWKLTDDFRYYPHSSAGFYYLDEYKGYDVIYYSEVLGKSAESPY